MTVPSRAILAEHLRWYAEWGVTGVSRDEAWRFRTDVGRSGLSSGDTDGPSQTERPYVPEGPNARPEQYVGRSELPSGTSGEALLALRAHIGDCTRCKLHKMGRRQVVFGVGNPNADLMFVGEAPGADEDMQGEPFVGRAGQLLTRIIEGGLQLKRSDVYIANVIKCRPPGNRNPEPDEVATCEPFLNEQIDTIKPRVIVALGTFAAHALLKTDAPISRLRGKVFDYRGGSKLIPTFHPAFLLRSPERKRDVWEDIKKVRALLAGSD
jgi:DNA polymerase